MSKAILIVVGFLVWFFGAMLVDKYVNDKVTAMFFFGFITACWSSVEAEVKEALK